MALNSAGGIQGAQPPSGLSRLYSRYATECGLLIAIFAVIVIAILIDPTNAYLEKPWYNATEILRHASILGIFAMGAGIVIISGGIDLSSGSVIAFSGVICCSMILGLCQYAGLVDDTGNPVTANLPGWILVVAISGTLGVGFIVGSFHAWLITVVRLPPFIATLASLVGLRSLGRVLIQDVNRVFTSNANTQIYIRDATYKSLGNEWYIPVIICAVVALVLFTLMRSTVTGRHLYAIGGNEDAARLSGISTEKKKWLAYCIGTMTAALAGILYSSYVGGAMPDRDGLGYELNAIAAAVVGGCSLAGGLGTISGIVLGAIFLRVVIDAVAKTVKDNPDEFQGMIVGLLVVLAVTFNELRSQKGDRKKFFPGALGIVNIISLTVLMGLVAMLVTSDGDSSTDDSRDKLFAGCLVAGITFAVLVARKMFESRPTGEQALVSTPITANAQSDSSAGGSSSESGKQEIEGDGPGGGEEADEGMDS